MSIVRENINFERGINPRTSMGVGLRPKIEEWLEKYFIKTYHTYWTGYSNATHKSHYEILEDFTINVGNFFATTWKGNFPDFIQFNESHGDFQVDSMGLTTLRGCPRKVKGYFSCSRNNLKNLIGGPEYVTGSYSASLNPTLESLEGLANYIGGDFSCNNKTGLNSKDIPKGTYIGGDISVFLWSAGQW